jgi:hypothetical protein
MTASMEKQGKSMTEKYLALVNLIEQIQHRLQYSELLYIFLNLLVFFPSIFFTANVFGRSDYTPHTSFVLFILFSFVIGMILNSYWIVTSIRLQLKLKLRYFQARNLERKYNDSGEFFISDEARYFNPEIGMVESFDGKETIFYPKKGFLRMDGFIGSAKPRYLSLMIPAIFFIMYLVSFYSVLDFVALKG